MAENIITLQELKPETRKWTAIVQVMEKNSPRSSRNSRLFQRLILGDRQGTCMQATLFGADIELFNDSLEAYKIYRISNAPVRFINEEYRVVKNKFQLTINGATLVEKVEDTEEEPIRTNFTSFADLQSKAHNTLVDIVDVVVQINEPHQIKSLPGEPFVQELLLVTEELKPTFLSLWDHFIEREGCDITNIINTWPIIVGTRIKTTTTNGLGLSTKSTSCLMINPDIPEKQKIHLWCVEHREKIEAIILATQSLTSAPKRTTPNATNVMTTQEATAAETMEPYWIRATACITNLRQKFWYVGCSNCHKAIHVHCGRAYSCVHCKQSVTAQARSRFDVELNDDTGAITANCFGNHAEKLFYFTAEDLKANTDENITDKHFIENHLSKSPRLFLLKPYNLQLPYKTERRLTIVAIEDESDEASSSTT